MLDVMLKLVKSEVFIGNQEGTVGLLGKLLLDYAQHNVRSLVSGQLSLMVVLIKHVGTAGKEIVGGALAIDSD